jgi:para-nitrobenzyl esterase
MTRATLALLAAASLAFPAPRPQDTMADPKPIRTASGLVAGVPGRHAALTVFKGLPFAAPPIGPLRWRAPTPPPSWQGVRKADAFSANCIQTIVTEKKPWTYEFMAHGEVSEDCLYLNVWTPAVSTSPGRPVLVYLYGGGNVEGSGSVPAYDGEGLASKGLVVVTFNYRVGVLGFFAHPDLRQESSYHASGNYGLLDQIAAVRWVHDNIAAFGGDPDRVTIAGQSAGASAVHSLTASPLAKGLFHRAIADSGAGLGGTRTMTDQEADGVRFADAKKARTIADLRAMSWQDVVVPVQGVRFAPLPDGYALPSTVREVFAAGHQNDVPTLTGVNADEGGAVPQPATTLDGFQRDATQRYGDKAAEFLVLYPAATDEDAKRAQNDSARDRARATLYVWAEERAKTARTKVFTYFWTHVLPGPDAGQYGAFHTSEVPYVLNTLSMSERPFTPKDHQIADTLSSYWVNFATSGEPNGTGLPRWPAVTADKAQTMEVGAAFRVIPIAGSPARIEFFRRVLSVR